MAKPSTPRRKHVRHDVNTEPRWLNWEFLAAFGVDESGYTYLDAVKQHCCAGLAREDWLEALIRRARKAYIAAGRSKYGQRAAWAVFRRAGMIMLHDLMDDLSEGRKLGPMAAFQSPRTAEIVIIRRSWKAEIMPI
ncbi:MAG: hypothetical protein Q8O14_14810 [bacterium]|nr:hypothetical protein [bacterium]